MFQTWTVNFRTEVCSKAKNPMLALQWIKEIEVAKSLEDLITLRSITGKDFSDYEELDVMMAASLKRCYDKHTHFPKEIHCRRAESSKGTTDFSEGGTLLIWSTNIFVQRGPMTKFKAYRVCSATKWRTTTFRVLMYVGSKHYY